MTADDLKKLNKDKKKVIKIIFCSLCSLRIYEMVWKEYTFAMVLHLILNIVVVWKRIYDSIPPSYALTFQNKKIQILNLLSNVR